MTKLSVNINKIATLRNSRGGNLPDVIGAAVHCEQYGAQGITVHPRPDERHIRYLDVYELKKVITTEFNIEGYPSERFLSLVSEVKPGQVTLVPDAHDAVTSNKGWDTVQHQDMLKDIIAHCKQQGIRVSVFIDPLPVMAEYAARAGADRIELYTEMYASHYFNNPSEAIHDYVSTAETAKKCGLGVNAGHDLNLQNLNYLIVRIPFIDEVSIGHALISDALYYGLENTIQMYLRQLQP